MGKGKEQKNNSRMGREESTRVNLLLKKWAEGEKSAYDELIERLYDDLRRIAHKQFYRERPGHTLQTDDLVNKLYLKLLNAKQIPWTNRGHFLRSAARTMRQILIDHARVFQRKVQGYKVPLDNLKGNEASRLADAENLLLLGEIIRELEKLDLGLAQLADLKMVLGLTLEEIAMEMEIPPHKVKKQYRILKKFMAERFYNSPDP